MATKDSNFKIEISDFSLGFAPLAHLDSLTTLGKSGHATAMGNVDILSHPGKITQGPGLATLTAGTEAGAVTELINHITDTAVASNVAYAIGNTKLQKLSATAVVNTTDGIVFPHTITNATGGNSVIYFQGALYYFYNKSSGGDCGKYDLSATAVDAYFSVTPTGFGALESAPHPVAKKEDILMFGNGRYVGTFISSTTTLARQKLDFGVNSEVADLCFHANQWFLAVNSGITSGTNRTNASLYLYDGAALTSILSDEVAVGLQQIGFIMPVNGVVYVAYKDLSSAGGFAIGYISGRQIKPLRYFTGSLPTFAQKTLYKNTIIFVSNALIYSVGAVIEQLPVQISQYMDGGFSTVGALACPFGDILVASSQSTSFKLAKNSGFDTACSWKSIVFPVTNGTYKGFIDTIIVYTKTLAANASCALTYEYDQGSGTSASKTITTTGKRRHVFNNFSVRDIEDFRIALSFSAGNATNDCEIRRIEINGHWVENS